MAHEQEFVAVRMRHTIDQFPLVLELLMDHVYFLPKVYADRLLDTHACDNVSDGSPPTTPRRGAAGACPADRPLDTHACHHVPQGSPPTPPRLEAAALAPARRRG